MEKQDFYQQVREITITLLNLCAKYEGDEYEEQELKLIPLHQRIIPFPTAKTAKEKNEIEIIPDFLEFSDKELQKMPKEFNTLFKKGKIKARVRRREDGRYEIRCQFNNIKISASSKKNLETAKQKFIEKISKPQQYTQKKPRKSLLFGTYLLKWLETVKKPYVKENTYKFYLQAVKTYIIPEFEKKKIDDISALDLQQFLNKFTLQGKNRTAKKIVQILKPFFEYAVADDKIKRSPMGKVTIGTYEQKHGTSITREEEKEFMESFLRKPILYKQAYVFILYTGLRRSELATATIDDKWISVVTGKQRKGKNIKTRKIPISPILKRLLTLIDFDKIIKISLNILTRKIKEFIPNHHLHDLRHTFITRCQECGIAREIVSLWAGHAADSSVTSTVYTHLEKNEEYQLSEIEKFDYIL